MDPQVECDDNQWSLSFCPLRCKYTKTRWGCGIRHQIVIAMSRGVELADLVGYVVEALQVGQDLSVSRSALRPAYETRSIIESMLEVEEIENRPSK